ncbi:MerR family transcriptional regulator [Aminipila butyrica]|uniref:MerR family transcriptional regulator n=1 Tax=Aminipila butyrica TaxID=433296 RepID=A0A858BUU5_9FIRM|nr:MerR family transcriptional regulator [Aminipila butyrica]QIB69703.1 MerR family transcriptional regulator [Aminipila butyrica]
MAYSIHDVAKHFQISEHTIRFYDKEGLFPFLSRNKAGNREFTESDLEWVKLVCCLKNTGMKIKEIRQYMELCQIGEETVEQRKNIFINHRAFISQQIEQMQESLKLVDAKLAFYDNPNTAHSFRKPL